MMPIQEIWGRLNAWYGLVSARLSLLIVAGAVGGSAIVGVDILGITTVIVPEWLPLLLLALVVVGLVRWWRGHAGRSSSESD